MFLHTIKTLLHNIVTHLVEYFTVALLVYTSYEITSDNERYITLALVILLVKSCFPVETKTYKEIE